MVKWRSENWDRPLLPSWRLRLLVMILRLEWLSLLRPDLVVIPRRFRVSIEGR